MAKLFVFLHASAVLHGVVATAVECEDNISVSLLQMDIHISAHANANESGHANANQTANSTSGSRQMSNLVDGSLGIESRQVAQHSSSRSKRPADFDKPRVYLANNCGGTSWIRDFAVELFEAHGYDIHMSLEVKTAGTPEGTTAEGIHTHDDIEDYENTTGISLEELHALHKEATDQGKTLLFKLKWPYADAKVLQEEGRWLVDELKNMGSYFVGSHRANGLDRLVCDVKDMFLESAGYCVSQETGEESDCRGHFDRGKSVDSGGDLGVYLYPHELVSSVKFEVNMEKDTMSMLTQADLFPNLEYVTYEDMSAFEAHAGLEHGMAMWTKFLGELGLAADQEILNSKLQPLVGTRLLEPHSQDIHNIEEVAATLEPYPDLHSFLRIG